MLENGKKKPGPPKIGPSFLFYLHLDVFLLSPRNGRENCPDRGSPFQGPFEMELLELPEVFLRDGGWFVNGTWGRWEEFERMYLGGDFEDHFILHLFFPYLGEMNQFI